MTLLALAGLLFALLWAMRTNGKAVEKSDNQQQVIDDFEKADKARALLDADASFAERLRQRFTR